MMFCRCSWWYFVGVHGDVFVDVHCDVVDINFNVIVDVYVYVFVDVYGDIFVDVYGEPDDSYENRGCTWTGPVTPAT